MLGLLHWLHLLDRVLWCCSLGTKHEAWWWWVLPAKITASCDKVVVVQSRVNAHIGFRMQFHWNAWQRKLWFVEMVGFYEAGIVLIAKHKEATQPCILVDLYKLCVRLFWDDIAHIGFNFESFTDCSESTQFAHGHIIFISIFVPCLWFPCFVVDIVNVDSIIFIRK